MSYPPRPPMVPGMPPMFMGMPPGMGIPPPMMPPSSGNASYFSAPPMRPGGPPPPHNMMRPPPSSISKPPSLMDEKPLDHPMPILTPSGPPVTVFVGNITEKWPDAMIRQLLATCGQVINWKRVQGASGKLQGFGFCEFNGPDAGLRAVRLLHELEVGDKKLVVKVDAKTSNVLEEYKAERKKSRKLETDVNTSNGNGDSKAADKNAVDYMDQEMSEADERSKQRLAIIFREFKNEIESYVSAGNEKGKSEKESSENKQKIQEKLHFLKLSSLDAITDPGNEEEPDLPEEIAQDEGKREIITREISIFRESMKIEKQREEERKKLGRERREKEREREERKRAREKGTEDINSPDHLTGGRDNRSPRRDSQSRGRNDRGGSRDRRDRRGGGGRDDRDRRDRDRDRDRRRRSRDRRTKSRSIERIPRSPDRAPPPPPKPRYREREEEEEQSDQKRLERKAREKEAAYEERLRAWEGREQAKIREYRKLKDRQKRHEDEASKEAKKMKQFLEDYDDEKHDSKYYRGKELQRKLADRARELEDDNRDRQKEREELEEMKLRMLTSNSRLTPNTPVVGAAISGGTSLLEKYKRGGTVLENSTVSTPSPNPTPTPLFSGLKMELKPSVSINSRLQAIANNQAGQANSATSHRQSKEKPEKVTENPTAEKEKPITIASPAQIPPPTASSVSSGGPQLITPTPVSIKSTSNPSTPNSLSSPAQAKASPGIFSGKFQMTLGGASNSNAQVPSKLGEDEDSRMSFSSPGMPSPIGMASASPQNFNNDDDSSMQSPLDAPKKRKIDVKDVFNQDEDEDGFGMGRKRKLVPLDFGEDPNKKMKKDDSSKNPEEKKKHIKALIDKIPTEKDALFAYEIDWEMVDTSLMEKRIRPWINKKIVEYIGEPEPTLVDFICSKVLGRSAPQSILEDVIMVLDEEAEVFVVKMWRLLVYEIEAKKYGLAGGKA